LTYGDEPSVPSGDALAPYPARPGAATTLVPAPAPTPVARPVPATPVVVPPPTIPTPAPGLDGVVGPARTPEKLATVLGAAKLSVVVKLLAALAVFGAVVPPPASVGAATTELGVVDPTGRDAAVEVDALPVTVWVMRLVVGVTAVMVVPPGPSTVEDGSDGTVATVGLP
jgi:hypothetical protein